MDTHWAIDLGTTNTLIARWAGTHAETLALDDVAEFEPGWHTPLIPSAVLFRDARRVAIGREAMAAQEALEAVFAERPSPLARSFKRSLARDIRAVIAEVDGSPRTARDCAAAFLGEVIRLAAEQDRSRRAPASHLQRLFAWMRREGHIRDLTMTAPVESFEPYRMALLGLARSEGVRRFRCLDEPVAAALGYGVDLTDDRNLLLVDFGGGTLDVALVRTRLAASGAEPRPGGGRHGELIAARGLDLGGETIDEWVTDYACGMLPNHAGAFRPLIRGQAERVKKELSSQAMPSGTAAIALRGTMPAIVVTRAEFLHVLEERGLRARLAELTEAVLGDARGRCEMPDIHAVLLVGGSTLLPGVREFYEGAFGPARVHYWEPFEAVVKGAATFGAGYTVDQIVHHDYAIRVFNDEQRRAEYEMLIPRGTPYPTPPGFQTRYYAVADGQTHFSVPVCEVGYAGRVSLAWKRRANDNLYWMPDGEDEAGCVVTLNESDMLRLAPPGTGSRTRLRIDFMVDEERYLCATVHDLLRGREVRTNQRITQTPLR